MDVRSWSVNGGSRYTGTLELGQAQRFVAKRLWINFGNPGNLSIALNGKPVSVSRGGAYLVRPGGITRAGLTRPRGFVVVTGSELVRGDRTDLNGPFLAQELLRLGVEPARIAIVGDDPFELETALREGLTRISASSRAGSARHTTTEPSSWSPRPPGASSSSTRRSRPRSKESPAGSR